MKYLFTVDITVGKQVQGTGVHTLPVRPGSRISEDMDPALQSSVDQLWTLYQLTGKVELKQKSHASPEKVGQADISGVYCHPSKSKPSEKESGQSPKPTNLSNTQLINTPNYVLVNDDETLRTDKERPRSGASKNWNTPFLSISLPVDPFCNDSAGNRPLFYSLTSDQGTVACSPVVIHEISSTASNEENGRERESKASPSTYTKWSIQITLKKK